MFTNFPFFPQQASEQAATVDALYFFLLAVTGFFMLLISVLVVVFAFKFRRKHASEVGEAIHGSLALELLWTFIPLGITMVMFVWGAQVFFHLTRAPKGAMEIFVVGKQWMWKAQHMDGATRDQRAARADRPPGQADDGIRGRHPQLLHPRLPREGGRRPRALQHDVVHGLEARASTTSSARSTAAPSTRR